MRLVMGCCIICGPPHTLQGQWGPVVFLGLYLSRGAWGLDLPRHFLGTTSSYAFTMDTDIFRRVEPPQPASLHPPLVVTNPD